MNITKGKASSQAPQASHKPHFWLTGLIAGVIIAIAIPGYMPIAQAETIASGTTLTAQTETQSKPSFKELLRIRRQKKKLKLIKIKATGKVSVTGFDEYQVPELNQESFESIPVPKIETPVTPQWIGENFFNDLTLTAPIPNTFYVNETFTIKGTVSLPSAPKTVFAFLGYTGTKGEDGSITYEGTLTQKNFQIPLRFAQPGNYTIGIIPGAEGKSKVESITVLPQPGNGGTSSQLETAHLTYNSAADKSRIAWKKKNPTSNIYRITLTQGTETVKIITRDKSDNTQDTLSITLAYADFAKFKPGTIAIRIEEGAMASGSPSPSLADAFQTTATGEEIITYHGSKTIGKNDISFVQEPQTVFTQPGLFKTSFTVHTEIEDTAAIQRPNGLVETIPLQSSASIASKDSIQSGSTVQLSTELSSPGRYILEINNTSGLAIMNIPVYVATGVPLIPDYADMTDILTPKSQTINLKDDMANMLSLVNIVRKGLGKNSITLDPALSAIAQAHAQDMITRQFFGHVNPDGLSPSDRRKKAKYPAEVGENLADTRTLIGAIQGLLRSPIHRMNILRDEWTHGGFGFAKDNKGMLKTVQLFAADGATTQNIGNLKSSILQSIQTARATGNASALTINPDTETIAQNWSQHLAQTSELGIETKDGQSLRQNIQGLKNISATQMFVMATSSTADLTKKILEPSHATESRWTGIGLGMSVNEIGEIKITLILTR